MGFLKKFNKESFRNCRTIIVDNYVYVAGTLGYYDIILTKSNINGSIVWQKKINSSSSQNYLTLIDIKDFQNGDVLLVLNINAGGGLMIVRISKDGIIIYQKSHFLAVETKSSKVCFLDDDMFCIYSDSPFNNHPIIKSNSLLKFSSSGDVVLYKSLENIYVNDNSYTAFSFSDVKHYNGKIFLCGVQYNNGISSIIPISALGIVIEMDLNFNIINHFHYYFPYGEGSYEKSLEISSLYFTTEGDYILSGVSVSDSSKKFITSPTNFSQLNINGIEKISNFNLNGISEFSYNNNYIYYSDSFDSRILEKNGQSNFIVPEVASIVCKINPINLENVWTKKYIANEAFYMTIDHSDIFIIVNHKNVYGVLNSEFDSCKTIEINNEYFSEVYIKKYETPLEINIINESNIINPYNCSINISPYIIETHDLCGSDEPFQIDLTGAKLQSPDFYLQAVGSNGDKTTKGVHLRWEFGGDLGENHIPKGNLASSSSLYNKPNDFVSVYRVPYNKVSFTVDFSKIPDFVNPLKYYWVYKYDGNRSIYIYFRNKSLFLKALSQTSFQNPLQFIQAYGGIIEIENKVDLFFGAELEITNKNGNSSLKLEGLSLAKKDTYNAKVLSYRKLYKSSELNTSPSLKIENGRSLRYSAKDCLVSKIYFEYYSDFISYANGVGWSKIDDYSLSLDDNLVFSRLEPNTNDNRVHGRWKRYNDNHYVNIDNYKHKWNVSTSTDDNSWERTIRKTVEKYVELSNFPANPRANEIFNFNLIESNSSNDEEGSYESYPEENNEVSNLDLLKLAALDFHVARMLGMGAIDLDQSIFSSEYVYVAVYDWKLNSGNYESNAIVDGESGGIGLQLLDYTIDNNIMVEEIQENTNHIKLISMSLPTSINSERPPLSIDISEIKFGLPKENAEKTDLYDEQGYTKDGKKRVISIYAKETFEYVVNPPFFDSFEEIDASSFTTPIYAGLEHRFYVNAQNPITWQSPELSHDADYFVYGSQTVGETLSILLPENDSPLYVHFHNLKGKYYYASYGIDWFSRASVVSNNSSSEQVKLVETDLNPTNTLLPPTGVNAHLIKEEKPLMFTSVSEQDRLKAIPDEADNTLVRLLFDYNAEQDIKIYNVDSEDSVIFPDDEEVFADQIEIFYRSFTPKNITAKAKSIKDFPNNLLLMQIETENYTMVSTGEVYESKYLIGTNDKNFIGGIFLMNQIAYVIHSVEPGNTNLKFNLYKKEASDILLSGKYADLSANILHNKLLLEIIEFTNINNIDKGDGLFVASENMQTPSNWGSKNPNQLKVKLGNADWSVNRELITITSEDGNVQNFIEKTRGFWKQAKVSKYLEDHILINDQGKYIDLNGNIVNTPVVKQVHKGIYKVEFNDFKLDNHQQFNFGGDTVKWFNGFVRLFKASDVVGDKCIESRTSLKVFRTENIGEINKNLVLYIIDENFKFDYKTGNVPTDNSNREFTLGDNILINYYPSYKVYLYSNEANDLIKTKVYGDKDTNYSIFGLRSISTMHKDSNNVNYASRFAPPTILLAQKTIVPQQPKKPEGPSYTTRPDFYGKGSYTFQVEFGDNPFAVQFYRADDNTLLNALYTRETIEEINRNLEILGGKNETYFADRWNDFLSYEEDKETYLPFPPRGKGRYTLPLPNNPELYESINEFIKKHNSFYNLTEIDNPLIKYQGEESELLELDLSSVIINEVPNKSHTLHLRDFVKEYLYNVFLPLTEVPVVYNQIYGGDYIPTNKKQSIRDKDGVLLKPKSIQKDVHGFLIKETDDEFEIAPMMKGIGDKKVSFTDFTIDATTDSFYFYAVREIGSVMKFGEFSQFLGPVKVVDANSPEAPKINSALPILSNKVLGINPKIKIEVHSYPDVQKIYRINLYRTTDRINAQAIMHMDLIKTIDISDVSTDDSNIWTIYDEFNSNEKVPFGEVLYYRITVEKQIEYAKADYVAGGENPEVIIDYVPSQPSKIISTMIVESQTPESPNPKFVTDEILDNATSINYGALNWAHTLYKGKYHIYKMSSQGNWAEIAKLEINPNDSNQFIFYRIDNGIWNQVESMKVENDSIFITLDQLNLLPLAIKDSQGNKIFHHFKVIAENNSNMLSTQENILTILNNDNIIGLEGISSDGIDGMITDKTFIIR